MQSGHNQLGPHTQRSSGEASSSFLPPPRPFLPPQSWRRFLLAALAEAWGRLVPLAWQ